MELRRSSTPHVAGHDDYAGHSAGVVELSVVGMCKIAHHLHDAKSESPETLASCKSCHTAALGRAMTTGVHSRHSCEGKVV